MTDMWRGRITSSGSYSASPGSAAVISAGWTMANEFEIVFDEDRQESELLPAAQALMTSADSTIIRTLSPQTYTTTVSGGNKVGLRLRFEDRSTGNLVKPSAFSLLVQVP